MKLTQKEITKLIQIYDLGEVKALKYIKGGAVNYNFYLRTNKGEFIVRILGREDKDLDKKRELEFKVLEYLKKHSFSYQIPCPIKNCSKQYISRINKKKLWIYRRLNGETPKKMNKKKLKEIARALAEYHRIMKGFPTNIKYKRINIGLLEKRYSQMRKVKSRNRVDRLMLNNLSLFEESLKQVKDFKFHQNVLLTHQDIHRTNVLFKGNKLIGILDFENLKMAPRINDIAYITKSLLFNNDRLDKRIFNLFLKEYERISPLTDKERDSILPYLAEYNCYMFAEFYEHCFDGKYSNEGCLKWTINTAKGVARELGWKI